jgi:thiopeptide-type bacteriocin biosynthesis protein
MNLQQPRQRGLQLSRPRCFTVRTPLLPIEELIAWGSDLTARGVWEANRDFGELEQAWMRDANLLRCRLRSIIDRSEIAHALWIASPSLQTGIEHWKRNPTSKKGLQAQRAIVKYFERMCSRSTPFGLFSGLAVGRLGEDRDKTALVLKSSSHNRLYCRLDFEYLFGLTAALRRDPALEKDLRYWHNSSLRRIADAWHYTESRLTEHGHSHHLVKIDCDPYLDCVVERAQTGATVEELVAALLDQPGDDKPSEQELREYVMELVRENELLVSSLSPLLTGAPPLDNLIQQLEELPSGAAFAKRLRRIQNRITDVERKGLAATSTDYEAITSDIMEFPAKFDLGKLYQVDMIKQPENVVLNKRITDELEKGIELLCRIGQSGEPDELTAFRDAFSARYDRSLVPLLEALDEDSGVGFGRVGRGNDASPLLRGLQLNVDHGPNFGAFRTNAFSDFQITLLHKLLLCEREGKDELELEVSDLPTVEDASSKLADAFSVLCTLAAPSAASVEAGDFELYIQGGAGPSGARLLGRFCYANAEIDLLVRNHLQEEEAVDPEAIYAEVVHLPEGRIGNVSTRPVLRGYEIPYLGRSGAPSDRQVPVSDLLIGVDGQTIVLWSQRLSRRIVPRLTNAHSFMNPRLSSVYRFLCYLQHHGGAVVPGFSWGPLQACDKLPRVRIGRLVLSLARWQLSRQEIEALTKEEEHRRFIAVQELRLRRELPRWLALQEGDNSLIIDLDNALAVDAFAQMLKGRPSAMLVETFPSPDRICVESSEGHFYHEFDIPFVRKRQNSTVKGGLTRSVDLAASAGRKIRALPPGSDWLFLKLYGGEGALDNILTTAVLPLVRIMSDRGAISRWFFVRYSDPHEHLRVRFNGVPARLAKELLPSIFQAFNPLLSSGKLWKIEFDTYEREIERYGGIEAVSLAEDMFWADSECVLDILQTLSGDDGLDIRWRIGLLTIDRLLSDCGWNDEDKRAGVARWCDMFQREFRVDSAGRKRLSDKFRAERSKLEALFQPSSRESEFANQALDLRSVRIKDSIQTLRSIESEGKLFTNITELASSYVHMHVNRLLRSAQRASELVLYDFLFQLYDSRLSRKSRALSTMEE